MIIKRLSVRSVLSLFAVLFSCVIYAQPENIEKLVTKNTHNNVLLNLWGEQPQHIQDLYDAAYQVFSSSNNANYSDLIRDQRFRELCDKNKLIYLGGPMLGSISANEVKIWIRTVVPSRVEVRISIDGYEKTFGPVFSSEQTDMTAVVPVGGLKPGMKYFYRVFINEKEIQSVKEASFHTPHMNNEIIKGRIAFGSCFHRWGLGNTRQSEMIISRKPDALLLMGDVAVQDRRDQIGMHRADYLLRDFMPAWQRLSACVPVFATWDDHDYFDDDLSKVPYSLINENKGNVWEVFRYNWNNPSYGFGETGKGVFFRTRIGPADIIMLDNRYFRTGEKGSFLGLEQMRWLKNQLSACSGPFIIISCGTMWTDHVSGGKDSWGMNDPEGREELYKFIEENNIPGVLFISGDRHGARGFNIPRPSGFSFYEFGAASLGGRTGPPVSDPRWTTQFYGISGQYAFGEFTFDGKKDDPVVTFRLIGDDGTLIHEKKIKRSQLTPANYNQIQSRNLIK